MSRSIEPIVFASSINALAIRSIFCSAVLFALSAPLAKDSADDALTVPSIIVNLAGFYYVVSTTLRHGECAFTKR